jgi:hypothetical protein
MPIEPPVRLDLIFGALELVKPAVEEIEEINKILDILKRCLAVIFSKELIHPEYIFQAVKALRDIDDQYEHFLYQLLGLPLRYIVGKLLFMQAERNLGPICLPYLALIVANINFDLEGLGINDLITVIDSDLRYYPDARLAILSKLTLKQPNSVAEMARYAQDQLNFSIPDELKQII